MLLEKNSTRVFDGILESTGNTPLIQLNKLIPGNRFHIFGKLEAVNPSGSIKDRTAGLILKRAIDSGRIKKGHTIVESSSGNMALGLAQACLYYGLHLIVVVDSNLNGHTEKMLRAYGAKIECVGLTEGNESYLSARLARVKELLEEIPGSYWTNQYGNPENPMAHQVTMKEIYDTLDCNLDYLFVATSTCGTLMGCADYISQNGLDTNLIAVDAVGSVLFGGKPKKRLIPGHGAGVPSQFLDTSKIYDHVEVSDHLDGYSIEQRGTAVMACIELAEGLKSEGYKTEFIDMGGGILMNYLESEREWNNFRTGLENQVREQTDALTFNGTGLGYSLIDGKLTGKLKTYPYFNKIYGAAFLDRILNIQDERSGKNVSDLLKESEIEIRIEPGRSLLDQTGITVARVRHRKQDSKGQWMVGLEMNMSQLMSSSADFLLDPYVVYSTEPTESDSVAVYFTGAFCLERDIILKRKIHLPRLPEIGDIVVFVNTAGYTMHFYETEAHLFDLSKNLVFRSAEGPISLNHFEDDFHSVQSKI